MSSNTSVVVATGADRSIGAAVGSYRVPEWRPTGGTSAGIAIVPESKLTRLRDSAEFPAQLGGHKRIHCTAVHSVVALFIEE